MTHITEFWCDKCQHTECTTIHISKPYTINGKQITVADIPALQCRQCGNLQFEHEAMLYIETQLAKY